LPVGEEWTYEPKLDGFRGQLSRHGRHVDLRSRSDASLASHFPEITRAAQALPGRFVLDGEIVAVTDNGMSFEQLQSRFHRRSTANVVFVAFDVLRLGDDITASRVLQYRRDLLDDTIHGHERLVPMPRVDDTETARRWLNSCCSGIEGVVAKRTSEPYLPGRRAWVKIKNRRTLDVVIGGCRPGNRLLLGLFEPDGRFSHIGETVPLGTDHARLLQRQLTVANHQVWTGRPPGVGHWDGDQYDQWTDCDPMLVVEVSFTQTESTRFRHPVRLLRLRLDRESRTCEIGQIPR
jgi:ATP-dependent DNA ligase